MSVATRKEAQDLHKEVKRLATAHSKNGILLGAALHKIKVTKSYVVLGYQDYKRYVEAEARIGIRMADYCARIHKVFVVEGRQDVGYLAEIGISRLIHLLPLHADGLLNDDNLDRWLEIAREKSITQLKVLVAGERDLAAGGEGHPKPVLVSELRDIIRQQGSLLKRVDPDDFYKLKVVLQKALDYQKKLISTVNGTI